MTQNNQKTEVEKGLEVISGLVKDFEQRKAETGFSYFKGKNRLCKVLNSKKGIRLELNVLVPEALEKKHIMTRITKEVAKAKHLGTMKYSVIALQDAGALKEVIEAALVAFKAEYEPTTEVKPEVKEEPKATEKPKAKAQ